MTSNTVDKQWVDLHLHTSQSDGSLSPSELVRLAAENDVGIIAVTDHDTTTGVEEARAEAANLGLRLIPAVEISAEYKNGTLHILGYGINHRSLFLLAKLKEFQDIRRGRNEKIIRKLNDLGIDISLEEIEAEVENAKSLGRPHIAGALVRKGIVADINQGFEEYLGRNRKAYVRKDIFTAQESIDIIRKAGGKAFLAHPTTLYLGERAFEDYVARLKDYGLEGMEVHAPIHSAEEVETFKKIAEKMNLLISAGSDFHGKLKPHIKLGHCCPGQKIGRELISGELLDLI